MPKHCSAAKPRILATRRAAPPRHRRNRQRATNPQALFALSAATVVGVTGVSGATSYAEPNQRIEEVRKRVDHLYHEAERITERANELEIDVRALQRRVGKVRAELARKQDRLDALRRQIGQAAAADYRAAGRLDPAMQLLFADDPDDYLAQVATTKSLESQEADLLRRFQAERKALAERQAELAYELAELREAKKETDERRKAALAKAAQAKALLERLTEEQRRRLEAERRRRAAMLASRAAERAKPSPSPSPTPTSSPDPKPSSGKTKGEIALEFAKAQLGEPYVFGADGPDSWDCSGLTMQAWAAAGVSLPHSARMQYDASPHVSRSELRPGDLVFFYSDISHVGIYAGDGMVIHAPRPGQNVEYIDIDWMPYAGATRPG